MESRSARLWSTILIVALLALTSTVLAQETETEDRASSMLEQGIRQYQKGEYERATQTLDKLLELKPESQDVLALRRQVDLQLMVEMTQVEDEALSAKASRLLNMMTEAVRQLKKDVKNPENIRTGMQSPDLDAYLDARVEALSYGPFVIPELLPLLTGKGAKAQKTVGRTMSLLVSIGRRATLPLVAVLQSDDDMIPVRAANVLGQVGDIRAVPALMTMWQAEGRPKVQRMAAAKAVQNIMGENPEDMRTARSQYVDLISDYLEEDRGKVGYVFGSWSQVWTWNESAENLTGRLEFNEVPAFLYYQRQGQEFALQALATYPGSQALKSLLVATMVRELETARLYTERGEAQKLKGYAEKRVDKLGETAPLLTHLYSTSVVSSALHRVMDIKDSAASYYLVKRLGEKSGTAGENSVKVLTAATHYPGKDARYQAAIELVKASPMGRVPEPDQVMQVIAAALRQTVQRTALIVANNLQFRNKLRSLLKDEDVGAIEADANVASVEEALNLNPSIDVIFVYGNMTRQIFDSVYKKLLRDGRTENKTMYVFRDPDKMSPELADYDGIEEVLSVDALRKDPLAMALKTAFRRTTVITSPKAEESVLRTAEVLKLAPYAETRYPLYMTEPALMSAIKSYTPEVTLAAAEALGAFGTARACKPLAAAISAEGTTDEVKIQGCFSIASILQRSQKRPEGIKSVVLNCYQNDNKKVREAAAEALAIIGLKPQKILDLTRDAMQVSSPTKRETDE